MRGRSLTWTLRGLLAAFVLVLAWTAVVLLTSRDDLQQAKAQLEQARAADDPRGALAPLAGAERDLQGVSDRMSQPGPALVARVPLLGRSVSAVSRSAEAALAVTQGTRSVLTVLERGSPLFSGGRVDTARLLELERALTAAGERSAGPVAALRRQPLGLVPGAVARPARTAQRELRALPGDFRRAGAGARAVHHLVGGNGPQRLLLLLENNAELRATGGVVTVFAEAVADDGRLRIDAFRDVADVADGPQQARTVPAPADYVRLYGPYKANSTLWLNTNMSPDVPTSSRVLAEVAARSTGRRPDAMVWLDVPAIAAVLRATGPATLPDGSVLRAEDAVTQLLSTAYQKAPDTPAGQGERRSELTGAADAVLGDLLDTGTSTASPSSLARELLGAARGRHLALWSADTATAAALATAQLDGSVLADGGDLSSFTVHNLGGGDAFGNKLDFYGRRQSTVDVQVDRDGAVVEQELALRNTAPRRGLPVYVAGGVSPGVSNSLLHFAVPSDAEGLRFSRDGQLLAAEPLPAGDHAVLTDVASLPPGQMVTWRLRYRVPLRRGAYRLTLYPQPLAVDSGVALRVLPAAGVRLAVRRAHDLGGDVTAGPAGAVRSSGPFAEVLRVDVAPERPAPLTRALERFRRFWREPVPLP